jgi:hypothetical protein
LAVPIQGAARETTVTDGAAPGPVGLRVWSALPGGTTGFNLASFGLGCVNARCFVDYALDTTRCCPAAPGGGGYIGNRENIQYCNNSLDDQLFYMAADASMNDAASAAVALPRRSRKARPALRYAAIATSRRGAGPRLSR